MADQAAARAEADKAIEATGQAVRERYPAAALAAEQDEKYQAALAAYDVTYTVPKMLTSRPMRTLRRTCGVTRRVTRERWS